MESRPGSTTVSLLISAALIARRFQAWLSSVSRVVRFAVCLGQRRVIDLAAYRTATDAQNAIAAEAATVTTAIDQAHPIPAAKHMFSGMISGPKSASMSF